MISKPGWLPPRLTKHAARRERPKTEVDDNCNEYSANAEYFHESHTGTPMQTTKMSTTPTIAVIAADCG
jgi:hypothetical protein